MLLVVFHPILFDITLTATHTPGACNTTADQILKNCMISFFTMNADASQVPAPSNYNLTIDITWWTILDITRIFELFLATITTAFHTTNPSL